MPKPVFAGEAGKPSQQPVSIVPGGVGTPIPDVPQHFGPAGAEAWSRLWTVGRRWLSNEAHWDLMVQLCEAIERRDTLSRETRKRNFKLVVRGSMGQDRVNPILETIDKTDAKVTDLLVKLRFQPAEQKQKTMPAKSGLDTLRDRRRTA
jgi:hypothetical protein